MNTKINDEQITIDQRQDFLSGSMLTSSNTAGYQAVNEITASHENMPDYRKYDITIKQASSTDMTLAFRVPEWIMSEVAFYINDELHGKSKDSSQFYRITRIWTDGDKVSVILPIGIRLITLPDDNSIGAFRYGPEVLAGICEEERILHLESDDLSSEMVMENEREWGSWRYFFKAENQDPVIQFRRIRDIGYEPFQIYFKIKKD
jgi:hypothetical protein